MLVKTFPLMHHLLGTVNDKSMDQAMVIYFPGVQTDRDRISDSSYINMMYKYRNRKISSESSKLRDSC